jgi:hypothetical protein
MQGDIVSSVLLPLILAFIMFSLGLGLTVDDFRRIFTQPRALLVGVVCHFVILPLACFGLLSLWGLTGVFAVGFMVLAACPTGSSFHAQRRTSPDEDPGRCRCRGLLHQPRHQRDALRGRAGQRAAHARRAVPCSKAWPRARPTAMPAWPTSPPPPAAPGLRPGQRPGQPAQRAQGQGAGGQHRGRPRHHHVPYDAQLQSDIETVARNVSPGFVRTSQSTAACAATRPTPSPPRAACRARWPR